MVERCPACGEMQAYCEGHCGKERGVLVMHAKGRHEACSPIGCDTAFDHWIEEIMTDPKMVSA